MLRKSMLCSFFNLFGKSVLFEYFINACSVKSNVQKVKEVSYFQVAMLITLLFFYKFIFLAFINNKKASIKLDSGADVTVLSEKLYESEFHMWPILPTNNGNISSKSSRTVYLQA